MKIIQLALLVGATAAIHMNRRGGGGGRGSDHGPSYNRMARKIIEEIEWRAGSGEESNGAINRTELEAALANMTAEMTELQTEVEAAFDECLLATQEAGTTEAELDDELDMDECANCLKEHFEGDSDDDTTTDSSTSSLAKKGSLAKIFAKK